MCRVVQGRVAPGDARLFACPPSLALGRSCSLLVLPLAPLGSLLDLLNARLKQGRVRRAAGSRHIAWAGIVSSFDGAAGGKARGL